MFVIFYLKGKPVFRSLDLCNKWMLLAILLTFILFNRLIPDTSDLPSEDKQFLQSSTHRKYKKQPYLDCFIWKGQKRGFIVLDSLSQGIYIEGSAGSGKSSSVMEPIIYQAADMGFAGFLYDFKGNPPTLSAHMYQELLNKQTKFAHINITNTHLSHRCNPLHPSYLPFKLYAQEYASAILKNLNKEWMHKQDFWSDNAIAFFSAIIWFLKKHHGSLCSLPHALLVAMKDYEQSIALLSLDRETKIMIEPIHTAYKNNAEKQLAGVFSSLQLPFNKIYTKEIFWVLSGHLSDQNTVDLDVSNPAHPTMLTVANDPRLSDSLSSIIALIGTVCMKHINQQGKNKSIFLLDEAPTLFIPGLENLPATARSNNVSTIVCVQDFEQLKNMYGSSKAEVIRNNLGNQFFGMTSNLTTGSYVSKMAGSYTNVRTSINMSDKDDTVTKSLGKESYLTPNYIASQPPGHFTIKVAGNKPQFIATHLNNSNYPIVSIPSKFDSELGRKIEDNWERIHNEVDSIFSKQGVKV
ncbi:MAG: TraM recognition domain-containing protein (plasmid) [Candidatus Cardinium sp.]|uniref:type IV secretory system conjugative DNA transfer family protein n=1 Tax=Cardinium endosymbiont of Dermatophagoides farinae TaxID=2597823 RepID=UPI0016433C58|nr:TraM recognition domain-containing protein [Cardinium endosymbiont of Dermatophagoides farinae]UWW97660.1 MAG: TraM recognition domain-containing protein [Candidatus Cardinium sp.]